MYNALCFTVLGLNSCSPDGQASSSTPGPWGDKFREHECCPSWGIHTVWPGLVSNYHLMLSQMVNFYIYSIMVCYSNHLSYCKIFREVVTPDGFRKKKITLKRSFLVCIPCPSEWSCVNSTCFDQVILKCSREKNIYIWKSLKVEKR